VVAPSKTEININPDASGKSMKNKLKILLGGILGFAPVVTLAQDACDYVDQNDTIQGIICKAGEILGVLLPFLVALGVIVFVIGVIQYVIADDEEAKTKGRNRMIYGIIGMAVIMALWGLVRIVTNTFDLNTGTTLPVPLLPQ
jgi:uncharacterized BrkB/YihY/UPF0761 family membrane protein